MGIRAAAVVSLGPLFAWLSTVARRMPVDCPVGIRLDLLEVSVISPWPVTVDALTSGSCRFRPPGAYRSQLRLSISHSPGPRLTQHVSRIATSAATCSIAGGVFLPCAPFSHEPALAPGHRVYTHWPAISPPLQVARLVIGQHSDIMHRCSSGRSLPRTAALQDRRSLPAQSRPTVPISIPNLWPRMKTQRTGRSSRHDHGYR